MADKEIEYSVNYPENGLEVNSKKVAYLESGKVPTALLPDTVLGALQYKGTFDCSGGSYPTPVETGDYYICSVEGTISGTVYEVGDWLVYNGSSWDKIDATTHIDDSPVDGATTAAISSNWAYDHAALSGNGGHVPTAPVDPTNKWLRGDGTFQTLPSLLDRMSVPGRISGNREIKDDDGDLEAFKLTSTNDYVCARFIIPYGFPVDRTTRLNIASHWTADQATGANFKISYEIHRTTFAVAATIEDLAVPAGNDDVKLALYKEFAANTFQVGDQIKIKFYKPSGLTVEDLQVHDINLEAR